MKNEIKTNFSIRLRDCLIKNGSLGNGLHVKKLSTITGNSTQICRKYLKGEGLPELVTIIKIAKTLHVSPHWLMFGEHFEPHETKNQKITISKDVLRYIFKMYILSLRSNKDKKIEEITDFFSRMTEIISLTNENDEGLKKLIDISVYSINK